MVVAKVGTGFHPERIRKEVRDAGFTAVDIEVTAVGPVSQDGDFLVLELAHEPKGLVLSGGEHFDDLAASVEELGQKIRIRGMLQPSHDDEPPYLTVEVWEIVGD